MLSVLCWIIYGLIVGSLAKLLDRGPHPTKLSSTIIIGIIGSYIGGGISFLIGSGPAFSRSGILMGTCGGIIFCWIYRNWHLNEYIKLEAQKTEKLRLQLLEKIESQE